MAKPGIARHHDFCLSKLNLRPTLLMRASTRWPIVMREGMAWGLMMRSGTIPSAVQGMSSCVYVMPTVPFWPCRLANLSPTWGILMDLTCTWIDKVIFNHWKYSFGYMMTYGGYGPNHLDHPHLAERYNAAKLLNRKGILCCMRRLRQPCLTIESHLTYWGSN